MDADDVNPPPSIQVTEEKAPTGPRLLWPGVARGTGIGVAIFLVGYLLCVGDHTNYGMTMFLAVPIAAGWSVGVTADGRDIGRICLLTTLILSLSFLILLGWEGYICCLMAFPLLLVGMALGAFIGSAWQRRTRRRGDQTGRRTALLLLACPVFIAAADRVEKPFRTQARRETFSTELIYPGTPQEAWQTLTALQHMRGDRPFLLEIGLPVPERCVLEGTSVGARRTCYFNQGKIEQTVREWSAPQRMAFDVMESTLPGRKWLTFVDAEYDVTVRDGQTIVTRRSTIDSCLYPRWYWRPFEAWGVQSEHEFVLANILADAKRN